ncbi:hypothetical protein R5R35_010789 [Gryllus longicercus]|uniref:Glycerol kinase 5 n=1 Tax=Gryllus longicercus TaxID=2509291 RepID=A0AAN9VFQ0_9ORTH
MDGKFVAALDVGTTTIRCYIFDQSTIAVGSACDKVRLLYPQPGRVEIDPEELWKAAVGVVNGAIKAAGLSAAQVSALGVSTQRSSFVTWHRDTGRPFHNFITWKDVRADDLVRQWNASLTLKGLHVGTRLLYAVTRSQRFLAASVLKLMNSQVTPRLLWALREVPALREAAARGAACFGTVDTWLLHRLSAGALHVTDVSNASATGLYDPFVLAWSGMAQSLFGIPQGLFPAVWDTDADFGATDPALFGAAIPIRCSMADQAAATFGSCCFSKGDVKVTLGTGTFLDMNTGASAHASVAGLYPLVGWRVGGEVTYLVEGASHDTGTVVAWAQDVGLLKDPAESSDVASSVKDSGGVYFIPAFSGLQAPINDAGAAAGLLGVKPTTRRAHVVRAILESVAFRVRQLLRSLHDEARVRCGSIRIDGGVSRNDFVAQLLADVAGARVERAAAETSALGAAFVAGLATGVWRSREELRALRRVERVFEPRAAVAAEYESVGARWDQAVQRFLAWYSYPGQ